ncbi:SDR family NAD(P)-dependent oxidoreductase [Piscinibacter koreensis]|uniref:SDR family NAD(P)-dependent oxidoreductase n=1 Tax=Piscinibacter koreensis TaxID=2742824 RepID=A0A7Y6NL18_9BURK|nr:SDR family NAD(P)-dependent oxidoreductase [Schlegelella koreensis]
MTRARAGTGAPLEQTCLVLGGSSGLGRQLAQRFAAAGYAVVLLSSDRRDLEALAADLRLRFGVGAAAVAMDLRKANLDLGELDLALEPLPPLTVVLAPAGMNADEDRADLAGTEQLAIERANFGSIRDIVVHCLPRLRSAPAGLVVGFGSVAAVRGRTRNATYAAAKRALQSYFESLRHALSTTSVRVQFYVLGYLDTNLAFGKTAPFTRASPERLAGYIYQHRSAAFGVKYHPAIWRPICMVVRLLPWSIFRRLRF